MKHFLFLALVCLSTPAFADVYVLINDKKEVLSISDKDDAVVEVGMEKVVIPGKIDDYGLILSPNYYKLSGKKFVQNNKKISDEENRINKYFKKQEEIELIEKKAKLLAMQELEKEGKTFQEVKPEDFK